MQEDGGTFTVEIDGTLIDSHFFMHTDDIKRGTLAGNYVAPASGLYTLRIENTRGEEASTCLYNYIDNISLKPFSATFSIVGEGNIPVTTGLNTLFSVTAGFGNGVKDYWIWFSVSGTFPGFSWSGYFIPLNQDPLFWWGLQNPNFPGSSGFFGTLSSSGSAFASLTMPPDPTGSLVGFPIHFACVILSSGHKPPVQDVSNPVHVKYCP
ncbi:MAG: hypothetical protein ACYTG7_02070 [Planctomycetota bacterium]